MAKKKAVKKSVKKAAPRQKSSSLPTTRKIGRYDDVLFEFYNDNTSVEQHGTVIIRSDAMVLDIPEQDGIAAALVIGRPHGTHFRGSNSSRDPNAVEADARWADLGDVFAGVWQDENDDLLFKFHLPKR